MKDFCLLLKYLYRIILTLLITISIITLVFNSNPIDFFKNYSAKLPKPRELIITNAEFNKEEETLVVPEGIFKIKSYSRSKGWQFPNNPKDHLFIIKYTFTANKDNVKPFKVWKKYIYATQNGVNLEDGMLRPNNIGEGADNESIKEMNNSVSILKKGETVNSLQAYFIEKNGEVEIKYPKYTEKR